MEEIFSELKQVELSQQNFGQTLDQFHSDASSALQFTLQWEEIRDDLDSSRSCIQECAEQLQAKEKELQELQESLNKRERELEAKEKRVDLVLTEVRVKEEKCDERRKEIELKEKQLNEQELKLADKISWAMKVKEQELGGFQETLEKRAREIEVREKEQKETQEKELARMQESVQTLEKRAREIEMREQKVNESERKMKMKVEVKECEGRAVVKDRIMKRAKEDQYWKFVNLVGLQLPGIVSLVKGKALQVFLNENSEYHDKMREKLASSLRLALDPAKLVLDGLEGFYPLQKGKVEFEGCVVKRSCNLLLEQLMTVSPIIKPHVRAEAMKLEVQWRKKMRIDAGHYLEVLAYLLLVASYGLDSGFNTRMLLSCLETVAAYNNAPSLIRLLGLKNEVPDVIRNLIAKKQQVEAIKFICAFELIEEFQPVPLLKMYLKESEEALVEATQKRVSDLRTVVRCIEQYKIGSELLHKLMQEIALLEEELLGQFYSGTGQ